MIIDYSKETKKSLIEKLEASYKTNRRLNRRATKLEGRLARYRSRYFGLKNALKTEIDRLHDEANSAHALYRELRKDGWFITRPGVFVRHIKYKIAEEISYILSFWLRMKKGNK